MLPPKNALFMNVVFLTLINIYATIMVIKDLSIGLDAILSGILKIAQFSSVALMIGLSRFGMLVKRSKN